MVSEIYKRDTNIILIIINIDDSLGWITYDYEQQALEQIMEFAIQTDGKQNQNV